MSRQPAGRPSSTRPRGFAADLGVRHVFPATDELSREGYRANAGDRCYFCKAELLDVVGPLAAELGMNHVATGTNADDARAGFRPGIAAAAERAAVTPLLDAGLTKEQVRAASRAWGLATWDKPAAACLSSRVAYGLEITPARLARVERAEAAVRAALSDQAIAAPDVRVRDLGDRARLEVTASAVAAVAASETCSTRSVRRASPGRGRPAGLPVRGDERAAATTRERYRVTKAAAGGARGQPRVSWTAREAPRLLHRAEHRRPTRARGLPCPPAR